MEEDTGWGELWQCQGKQKHTEESVIKARVMTVIKGQTGIMQKGEQFYRFSHHTAAGIAPH